MNKSFVNPKKNDSIRYSLIAILQIMIILFLGILPAQSSFESKKRFHSNKVSFNPPETSTFIQEIKNNIKLEKFK